GQRGRADRAGAGARGRGGGGGGGGGGERRSPAAPATLRGSLRPLHVLRTAVIGRGEVAPLQRAFLAVGFSERDGELRLAELASEIKGMGRLAHLELGEDLVD